MRDALAGLKSAAGFLRREVAQRVNLRAAPEPMFFPDDSIRHGAKILSTIYEIEKARRPRGDGAHTMDEAKALLLRSDNILILTHRRPDGDTLGCAGALCRALRGIGKNATYILKNPKLPRNISIWWRGSRRRTRLSRKSWFPWISPTGGL
jgi:hypothetical protein